jgi:hypothetical protein
MSPAAGRSPAVDRKYAVPTGQNRAGGAKYDENNLNSAATFDTTTKSTMWGGYRRKKMPGRLGRLSWGSFRSKGSEGSTRNLNSSKTNGTGDSNNYTTEFTQVVSAVNVEDVAGESDHEARDPAADTAGDTAGSGDFWNAWGILNASDIRRSSENNVEKVSANVSHEPRDESQTTPTNLITNSGNTPTLLTAVSPTNVTAVTDSAESPATCGAVSPLQNESDISVSGVRTSKERVPVAYVVPFQDTN